MSTSEHLSRVCRKAAYASWESPDQSQRIARIQKRLKDHWERVADPEVTMTPEERSKAGKEARRAHLTAISAKGVAARKAKREAETK